MLRLRVIKLQKQLWMEISQRHSTGEEWKLKHVKTTNMNYISNIIDKP